MVFNKNRKNAKGLQIVIVTFLLKQKKIFNNYFVLHPCVTLLQFLKNNDVFTTFFITNFKHNEKLSFIFSLGTLKENFKNIPCYNLK